ncbi:transposase InsO family protein [Pedobacter sp. CG_S7]|uniref:IS3 family transposase n=1 Tax=Pedobacter sp. CG_S7 TaxID=3143930 RepID=UPI0033996626
MWVLCVGNSSFYYWLKHPQGKRELNGTSLLVEIQEAYQASKGRYGSPRITAEQLKKGIQTSRPRVARLMRKWNIRSIVRKKWVQTTDSDHMELQ